MVRKNILLGLIILSLCSVDLLLAVADNRSNRTDEKTYLFPGTGFFIKNREPYDDHEAKEWFHAAVALERDGHTAKALKIYKKFTKRRTDVVIDFEGAQVLIGPEAIYRLASIEEKQGDWKSSFEHLELIAKAYVLYDFSRVAESLLRIAEKIVTEKQPKKWGFLPRLSSSSENRARFLQIVELAKGPKFAPRALMILANLAIKDEKEDEAIDALERLINFYPENFRAENAFFMLAEIYRKKATGPSYDQHGIKTALYHYEDYLILYDNPPPKDSSESSKDYQLILNDSSKRKEQAQLGVNEMSEILAQSKIEVGEYVEKYGKYFLVRWKELGNEPALKFYREAIDNYTNTKAAREAERRIKSLTSEE